MTDQTLVERLRADHDLKVWPEYFAALIDGSKPFEARKDDRRYRCGDVLRLREYDPITGNYSGRELLRRVTYLLVGGQFGIEPGYVVMGLADALTAAGQGGAAPSEGRKLVYAEIRERLDWHDARCAACEIEDEPCAAAKALKEHLALTGQEGAAQAPPSIRDNIRSAQEGLADWGAGYKAAQEPPPQIMKHRSGCAVWVAGRPQQWIEGDEALCDCGATQAPQEPTRAQEHER